MQTILVLCYSRYTIRSRALVPRAILKAVLVIQPVSTVYIVQSGKAVPRYLELLILTSI